MCSTDIKSMIAKSEHKIKEFQLENILVDRLFIVLDLDVLLTRQNIINSEKSKK